LFCFCFVRPHNSFLPHPLLPLIVSGFISGRNSSSVPDEQLMELGRLLTGCNTSALGFSWMKRKRMLVWNPYYLCITLPASSACASDPEFLNHAAALLH